MIYSDGMERVGVRELRQNASRVVSDVERAGAVVVTVNGRDAVLMTPLTGTHRWVPAARARDFWEGLPADPDLASEIDERRNADRLRDPWESGS